MIETQAKSEDRQQEAGGLTPSALGQHQEQQPMVKNNEVTEITEIRQVEHHRNVNHNEEGEEIIDTLGIEEEIKEYRQETVISPADLHADLPTFGSEDYDVGGGQAR